MSSLGLPALEPPHGCSRCTLFLSLPLFVAPLRKSLQPSGSPFPKLPPSCLVLLHLFYFKTFSPTQPCIVRTALCPLTPFCPFLCCSQGLFSSCFPPLQSSSLVFLLSPPGSGTSLCAFPCVSITPPFLLLCPLPQPCACLRSFPCAAPSLPSTLRL